MTNDLLTPLIDIGVLLILLMIASLITGTVVFVIEALRRIFLRAIDAASPQISNSTEAATGRAPITNAP